MYENSFKQLKQYVENENFRGWDPFDGLNSKLFQTIPVIKNTKWGRLLWLQLFKRNPINLRKVVLIPKEHNPKALGLFLTGYCNLYEKYQKDEDLEQISFLADRLLALTSKGYSGAAWGYNFDWQARAFFQPKFTPTVVATSFIVDALIRAYKITRKKVYLDQAISSSDFILQDLNKTFDAEGDYCLSYSPLDQTQVFNAGLLGAKTLSLIYDLTGNESLIKEAEKIVRFVIKHQNNDGSWAYGTLPFHRWIDNFHTGYNLEALITYQKISGNNSYQENINKGLDYYLNTFFTEEGVSKYYNDKIYPVDIHAPAQLIVSLSQLGVLNKHKSLADKVLTWTIKNMQSHKGYFYYQKNKFYTNKIPYMRWSNAWMFYAMSYYLRFAK